MRTWWLYDADLMLPCYVFCTCVDITWAGWSIRSTWWWYDDDMMMIWWLAITLSSWIILWGVLFIGMRTWWLYDADLMLPCYVFCTSVLTRVKLGDQLDRHDDDMMMMIWAWWYDDDMMMIQWLAITLSSWPLGEFLLTPSSPQGY